MHFGWLTPKGDERERYEYYRTSHISWLIASLVLLVIYHLTAYDIVEISAVDAITYTFLIVGMYQMAVFPPGKSDHAFMEKRLRKLGSIEEMRRKNDSPATFITLGVALLGLSILARERLQLVGLIVLLFGGLMWYYYRLNRYEKKIIDMIEEEELEKKRIETISGGHHVDV